MIVDQYGRPIPAKPPELPPSVLGLNSGWSSHPVRGLTPSRLASILAEAEDGDATRQAELFEDMEERDGKLASLLQTRKLAVTSLEWYVQPADDSPRAAQIATEFERVWWELDVEDLMLDALDAIGKGVSMQALEWRKEGNMWRIGATAWIHPKHLTYRADRRWALRTPDSPMGLEMPFGSVLEHTYKARSGSPQRSGLLRTAAWLFYFKHWVLREWLSYTESFARPFRIGKYPAGSSAEEQGRLEQAVRALGNDAAGIIPDSMVVDIVHASTATGPELYERIIEIVDREMAQVVLGQTLTSSEGARGTQALGRVHEQVRRDLLEADARRLATSLRRDVVRAWTAFNYGSDSVQLAPYVLPRIADEVDLQAEANVLSQLVSAGLPVAAEQVRERFGYRAPREGDEVLAARPRVALNRRAFELPDARVLDGQMFVYQAVDAGVAAATPALEALTAQILRVVEASTGADELRERLRQMLPEMDVVELGVLMERLILQTNLAGRWAMRSGG